MAIDLRDAIMKLKEAKEKRHRRQIEALRKLSDVFNIDLEEAEQKYVRKIFRQAHQHQKQQFERRRECTAEEPATIRRELY